MRTSGDVDELELGTTEGRDVGFRHPAVLVTAKRIRDVSNNSGPPFFLDPSENFVASPEGRPWPAADATG